MRQSVANFSVQQLLVYDAPGTKFIKMAWVINFQKCLTLAYVSLLMGVTKNYSIEAYTYLALHGSYGLCWFMKHLVMPDQYVIALLFCYLFYVIVGSAVVIETCGDQLYLRGHNAQ